MRCGTLLVELVAQHTETIRHIEQRLMQPADIVGPFAFENRDYLRL